MMAKPFSFDQTKRIRKRSEFSRVQASARRLTSKHFLLLVSPATQSVSRVGITITRKVEPRAVYRNKLKRRLREIFRLNRTSLLNPFDIVIIARKNATTCDMAAIRREILGTLKHAGLLKRQSAH